MKNFFIKLENCLVNFCNRAKIILIIAWSIIVASFCLVNREQIFLNIPFTSKQVYLSSFILILFSYPVLKISMKILNIFHSKIHSEDGIDKS